MRLLVTSSILLLTLMVPQSCTWSALHVNNAHHMTIERWTAERVPKRFRVLDAETGEPVAGARLMVVHDFDWMDDWTARGTTNGDGVATFRLAKKYLHLLEVHAAADGYLTRVHLHFEEAREPGTGRLSDDPVDVRLYKGPEPTSGLRLPAGFRGTVVYRFGPTKYDFPFPPDFPAGQRVWWTDVKPGTDTVVEQAPRLGFDPATEHPFQVADANGQPVPTPPPGADVDGVAAWRIGTLTPKGNWSREDHVLVIGDRAAAVAKAKELWEQHRNGPTGYIFNGWLRTVSPQTMLRNDRPDGITRPQPPRR